MKRKIFTLLILTAISAGYVCAQQDSVLRYFGFESSDETSSNFYLSTTSTSTATLMTDETIAHSGSGYYEFVVTEQPTNDYDNQFVVEHLGAEDSTIYRVSIWMKAVENTDAAVNLTIGKYNYSEFTRIGSIPLTTTWQKFSLMVYIDTASTLPTTPNEWRVPIHARAIGDFLFDDLKIERTNVGDLYASEDTLSVDFGWALDNTVTIDPTAFTVKIDTTTVNVTSAKYESNYVKLRLAQGPILKDSVFLSYNYAKGQLKYDASATGAPVDKLTRSFTNERVTNKNKNTKPNNIKGTQIASLIQLSPNPVKDILTISNVSSLQSVDIFNLTGQRVLSVKDQSIIDVSSLIKGTYIVSITCVNDVANLKIVKR